MNKHGLSADLLETARAILNGQTPIEEKMSSKEKMKKGLYNDNSNDQSDDGEGMDKVQPKALKKKFKDRKDKDIDNNGKVDKSDEYIDNKRKAISKAMNKEAINAPILKTANNHDPKHVKQAIGIASDPRFKKGNMTGAVKAMNKISPGLHNHPQVKAVLKKQNESFDIIEDVHTYSMHDSGRGEKHIDKAHDLHTKHKFTGVKFHTAMGDDMPHAVSVHKDSPAHKHPEFHKAISKLPVKYKSDHSDTKDMSGTSVHKESVDIAEDVTTHSIAKEYPDTKIKGEKHLDKAEELHKKHNFKGVKFHTAMGDDMPHAVSVHKDSDAHKHPEMHKALSKIPFKSKMSAQDAKKDGIHASSLHKESADLDDKNVSKALKHDCATHIVHEKWGSGQCIPGMHTIVETSEGEGFVTHYDILFNHGIEEDVSVKEIKIIKEKHHGHMRKKKMKEGMADYDPKNKIHVALRKKDPTFRNPNITPAQKAAKAKKGADSLKKMKKAFDGE